MSQEKQLLQKYPLNRVDPIDGMAITAEVWKEAHDYHRLNLGYHVLFGHGSGIVTGLEIVASDPADTSVYISAGIAVDPLGQTLVLPQSVFYDLGHEIEGRLYLILSYGEVPSVPGGANQKDAPHYARLDCAISARSTLPATPHVELARIRRSSREAVLRDASSPLQPGLDEIDLRFRREIGAPRSVSLAICYLGDVTDKRQGRGAVHLASALNHSGSYRIAVYDDVPLAPGVIENSTLIYLVGQGNFELNQSQVKSLNKYLSEKKGTLLLESIDSNAESAFLKFLRAIDNPPKELAPGHRLLTEPNLFVTPPAGFEPRGTVQLAEGIIFSTCNYGRLWQGEVRDRAASREEIRSAVEWGGNMVTYAITRRRMARS